MLVALLRARAAGSAVVLATRLRDGMQLLLPDEEAPPWLADQATTALRQDRSGLGNSEGEAWFLHVHAAAYRLLIIGAVHIAQALTSIASIAGLEPTVIDPRHGFAHPDRFPSIRLLTEWPDEAVLSLEPDRQTAIVTLTHDPKLDDAALDVAIRSQAFFIGALGSRKTHAARLERLRALGHPQASLDRIRGPVGLPIGAVTAPEIALSIVSEIVAVRRASALGAR